MSTPTVSVIIPAYNNAEFLGDAIQSVLAQTYPQFELIIVNDASPQPIAPVVNQFQDARIQYIVHSENQGLSAARNTGIRASTGELIALLDGDDWFHPEKFELHVKFLQAHPEIGTTYNARFELNHSSKTIRDLWRPPTTVTLADLVRGFPFSPSDMVMRREWAFRVNLFDVRHTYVGEDLDINCRLALEGCLFGGVDRALNYRRFHSGRVIKNLRSGVDDTIRPLKAVFADPRCPPEVLALQDEALANHYLLWSMIAFMQDETAIGQEFFSQAAERVPSILELNFSRLVATMISSSILDENENHEQVLRRMFDQLPAEAVGAQSQYEWAVGRGYLLKGTRAIFWNRPEDATQHFAQAAKQGAKCDEAYLGQVTQQLLNYEAEFDFRATQNVIQALAQHLSRLGEGRSVRRLNANYSINRAFHNYRIGEYTQVPGTVVHAISSDPRFLANRGVLAILVRSLRNAMGFKPIRV